MSSEQAMGGYRCDVCGMAFNSLSDLDAHTREKHRTYATTK
jgi:Zinc finger, C2H2 type